MKLRINTRRILCLENCVLNITYLLSLLQENDRAEPNNLHSNQSSVPADLNDSDRNSRNQPPAAHLQYNNSNNASTPVDAYMEIETQHDANLNVQSKQSSSSDVSNELASLNSYLDSQNMEIDSVSGELNESNYTSKFSS